MFFAINEAVQSNRKLTSIPPFCLIYGYIYASPIYLLKVLEYFYMPRI